MRAGIATAVLALTLGANNELPTEFRLFKAGWNDSEKGTFLFDEDAAAATIAAREEWAVDVMIDLEHQSLEEETPIDPTARDARGWCRLELREDGSLWAVGVTWTPDGAARLTEKRQRYVSPTFGYDPESKRITSILNVAITALPATHGTPALMAAAARIAKPRDFRKLSAGPAFSDVQCALSAALQERFPPANTDPMSCSSGPWVMDVFDATVVYELAGSLFELAYTFDGSTATLGPNPVEVNRSYTPAAGAPAPAAAAPAAPPPVTPAPAAPPPATTTNRQRVAKLAAAGGSMDPKLVGEALDALIKGDSKKCEDLLKSIVVSAAGGESAPPPAGDTAPKAPPKPKAGDAPPAAAAAAAPTAAPTDAPPDDQKDPMLAAARVAIAITGKTDPGEAMAELSRRSAVAVDVETREAKLAADRHTLEAGERRKLVGDLVKLGAEIPATAWGDDKGTVPCARLTAEPIAELRARVAKLSAAPGVRATNVTPPATPEGATADLTPREQKICAEKKIDPAKYAALRAGIRARNATAQGA